MTSMRKCLAGVAVVSALATGCGQSGAETAPNPELESTKQQLTTVSAERDALKTEAETAKQQVASLQQQLEEAKKTPAPVAKEEPAEEPAPAAKKEKARPKKEAPVVTEETKQEVQRQRRSF